MKSLVVLTGAGISAESGVRTFRDNNGLWHNHRIEEVATPEAFERDPKLVQKFYNARRTQLKEVMPNAAHVALAELAERWEGSYMLVTQNVDDLHDRTFANRTLPESFRLLHMHGELRKIRCTQSGRVYEHEEDITLRTQCACCHETGTLRPHIVWFGEMPMHMPEIYNALSHCDVFVAIGTSGNVYPAAGFVQEAKMGGARTVEINLEPSLGATLFDEGIYGRATEKVPEFMRNLLNNP